MVTRLLMIWGVVTGSPVDCVYNISTIKCRVAGTFISEGAHIRAVAKCHKKLHAHAHRSYGNLEVDKTTSLVCTVYQSIWRLAKYIVVRHYYNSSVHTVVTENLLLNLFITLAWFCAHCLVV